MRLHNIFRTWNYHVHVLQQAACLPRRTSLMMLLLGEVLFQSNSEYGVQQKNLVLSPASSRSASPHSCQQQRRHVPGSLEHILCEQGDQLSRQITPLPDCGGGGFPGYAELCKTTAFSQR